MRRRKIDCDQWCVPTCVWVCAGCVCVCGGGHIYLAQSASATLRQGAAGTQLSALHIQGRGERTGPSAVGHSYRQRIQDVGGSQHAL